MVGMAHIPTDVDGVEHLQEEEEHREMGETRASEWQCQQETVGKAVLIRAHTRGLDHHQEAITDMAMAGTMTARASGTASLMMTAG